MNQGEIAPADTIKISSDSFRVISHDERLYIFYTGDFRFKPELHVLVTEAKYNRDMQSLRSNLFTATGVIVALLLALGYVWLQNRKMRRYFR